jgi:hypothetical protein
MLLAAPQQKLSQTAQGEFDPYLAARVQSRVSFLFLGVTSMAKNDSPPARGQKMWNQMPARIPHEWTAMFPTVFPTFDRTLASWAG